MNDTNEGIIKMEPDFVSVQKKENEWCSTKQTIKKDLDYVLGSTYHTTERFIDIGEIKQEIIECEEQQTDVTIKKAPGLVLENVRISPITIKKELENESEVKAVHLSDIKQEFSKYVEFKAESELTSCCDLPTLKNESADCPDYFVQPCSSKQSVRILKSSKNTTKIVSKQKRRKSVCQKKFKLEQDLEDIIMAGGDDEDIEAVILLSILGDQEININNESQEYDLHESKLEQDLEDIIIAGGDDEDIETVILLNILGDQEVNINNNPQEYDMDGLSSSD